MSAAPGIQLVCPNCSRENEPERIYCHDCGARLDRSALANVEREKPEAPDELRKRVENMFAQRGARTRQLLVRGAKLLAAAGGAALVLLALLAPHAPLPKKVESLPAKMISLDLEALTQERRPPQLRYSEEEVNAYLAYSLKSKKEKLQHAMIDFEGASVAFHPAVCDLVIARSIFGYPVYTTGAFVVQSQNGKVTASAKAGAVGRLPIHPKLMEHAGFLFQDMIAAMNREHKLLARVGSVELRDKEVLLTAPQ